MTQNSDMFTPTRGAKTKQKILDTALNLFSTKGYKATTVRDIAGEIGIKQSALYNHFKNKDEILETLIEDLTTSAIANIFADNESKIVQKSPKSLLMGIATTFKLLGFDGQNEALYRLLMQEMLMDTPSCAPSSTNRSQCGVGEGSSVRCSWAVSWSVTQINWRAKS